MRDVETDYLVVGAGASGMAFTDALLADSDAEVVIVDRRHRPGGHWLDAYPFVRLHQPSANYGVNSRQLGDDRIDASGPNAGFYERATAAEICDYFSRVMDEQFLASGRVRFLPVSDYRGAAGDGHHVVSRLTGEETLVKVRRKLVDATYVESSIPSRHRPSFGVDDDARLVPPNDLVDLDEHASGFTILGAGKTAMDTCNWLLEAGVDPDRIQWFRPRDPWLFNRVAMQPLDHVGAYMQLQAAWVKSAAETTDGLDFARRLEAAGMLTRIDPAVEPLAFRGATISEGEIDALRSIERVVANARVQHVGATAVKTDRAEVIVEPGHVFVDCTAAGVRPAPVKPIFEPDRITVQYVTIGIVPWSAANIGAAEALKADDAEKNALCPPLSFSGNVADILDLAYRGMTGLFARAADPEINAWNDASRLNPAAAARDHLDDPRVTDAFATIGQHLGGAMTNLARLTGS
ncbi:MAG TPA: NAD(P)-binding protein [Acidimicrobiales bacterium]|nr:NAD(P)-binding protein [Acidimicrobiales bacterium]